MNVSVKVKPLPHFVGMTLPKYETEGAAGLDVLAALKEGETCEIWPGQRKLIPTGLKVAIPAGYELQVRSRSGLALCNGIVVANGIGTIDSDYRGEVGVILLNTCQPHESDAPFVVKRGARIAQFVLAPVTRLTWEPVANLDTTARGEGAYGSTGLESV